MIHMMTKEQRNKRKVITVKGVTRNASMTLVNELFEAFEQGYRPAPVGSQWTADAPVIKNNRKQVVLYPQGYDVPTPNNYTKEPEVSDEELLKSDTAEIIKELEDEAKQEVAPEAQDDKTVEEEAEPSVKDRIEALNSKADMLALAKELNIEVPEEKKVPAAIKKFLLESVGE